jgi:hypothetical protein
MYVFFSSFTLRSPRFSLVHVQYKAHYLLVSTFLWSCSSISVDAAGGNMLARAMSPSRVTTILPRCTLFILTIVVYGNYDSTTGTML